MRNKWQTLILASGLFIGSTLFCDPGSLARVNAVIEANKDLDLTEGAKDELRRNAEHLDHVARSRAKAILGDPSVGYKDTIVHYLREFGELRFSAIGVCLFRIAYKSSASPPDLFMGIDWMPVEMLVHQIAMKHLLTEQGVFDISIAPASYFLNGEDTETIIVILEPPVDKQTGINKFLRWQRPELSNLPVLYLADASPLSPMDISEEKKTRRIDPTLKKDLVLPTNWKNLKLKTNEAVFVGEAWKIGDGIRAILDGSQTEKFTVRLPMDQIFDLGSSLFMEMSYFDGSANDYLAKFIESRIGWIECKRPRRSFRTGHFLIQCKVKNRSLDLVFEP